MIRDGLCRRRTNTIAIGFHFQAFNSVAACVGLLFQAGFWCAAFHLLFRFVWSFRDSIMKGISEIGKERENCVNIDFDNDYKRWNQ